jgi:transposase
MIWLAAQGLRVPAIAQQLGIGEKAVRQRLKRFETAGLEGLADAPRAGRPRTYTEDVYSQVVAKARALPPKPEDAEAPPTCHWTLDRLQAELAKQGLPIKRSQIRRILKAEHLKWQQPRTWRESTAPDCAEKRGCSSGSTHSRPPTAR